MSRSRFTRREFLRIAGLTGIGAVAAACAPGVAPTTAPPAGPTSAPAATATTGPQTGGVLKMIASTGPQNLGAPSEAYQPADNFFALPCIERLLSVDEKGNLLPSLATGWQVNAEAKTITLTLRKGVKFHDGTDFNADAVKYLVDMHRTSARMELKAITSVDVVDDSTVRLNLTRYESPLLSNLVMRPGFVVSPTALKTKGVQWCLANPVGTGPFKFVNFTRDVSLKYEKFDGYWQKGKPYLDGIEWSFISDQVTALIAFKNGEANAIQNIDPKDVAELQATGKYSITKAASAVTDLAGDSAHPDSPWSKLQVRQALSHAIDRDAITQSVGRGLYEADNQVTAPGTQLWNPAVVGYKYDVQKAKDLLAAAGYPAGFKTNIYFQTSQFNNDLATVIQSYLSKVGIDATLQPQQAALALQTMTGGWNNGLVFHSTPTGLETDPVNMLMTWLSSKGVNYGTAITHPDAYEAKISEAMAETDYAKRVGLYQQLMKMVVDDYCLVTPLYTTYGIAAKEKRVQNLKLLEYWYTIWSPGETWLNKAVG